MISLVPLFAQAPQVPVKMDFAGIELHFNHSAQQKVQKYVNALRHSEAYFQAMVTQADIFFPVIERVFKEEGFPDDFKYLIIQESAFKPDAVSVSNAVGYWQFKKGTALDLKLRVDHIIDERKNIEASSRAMANYISQTNKNLDNWTYALLSYNMGPTGVLSRFKEKYRGVSKMHITNHTHWYILKCIAHKVAYQHSIHKKIPKIQLDLQVESGIKLTQIAKRENIDLEDLIKYNKWIGAKRTIPSEKQYNVAIPKNYSIVINPVIILEPVIDCTKVTIKDKVQPTKTSVRKKTVDIKTKKKATIIISQKPKKEFAVNKFVIINKVKGVTAKTGDTPQRLALLGGITKNKFVKYNEMERFTEIIPGEIYYFKQKKNKAKASFHVVKKGETLWSIAQDNGINVWAIRTKNKMNDYEEIQEGRVLWLKKYRSEETPIEYRKSQKTDMKKTHTIQKGDTLYSIAKKYGINVAQLKKINRLVNDNLEIGKKLFIK